MKKKIASLQEFQSNADSGPKPRNIPALIASPDPSDSVASESLLDPERPLMSPSEMEALAGAGVHSARYLQRSDPKKYQGITRALNEGIGLRSIAKAYGVSIQSVYAIREREYAPMLQDKTQIKKLVRKLARYSLERIEDELPTLPAERLPVLMGILIDKMQALDGEPNVIVGTTNQVTPEAWQKLLDSIPTISGEVVPLDPASAANAGIEGAE